MHANQENKFSTTGLSLATLLVAGSALTFNALRETNERPPLITENEYLHLKHKPENIVISGTPIASPQDNQVYALLHGSFSVNVSDFKDVPLEPHETLTTNYAYTFAGYTLCFKEQFSPGTTILVQKKGETFTLIETQQPPPTLQHHKP